MFTRILVPLDGSPESNIAVPAARTVAQVTGADIVLLRVVDPDPLELRGVQELLDEARTQLFRISNELSETGLHAEVVATYSSGSVADEILQRIHVENADLVVMRTHQPAGLEQEVLGGIAERVLNNTPVPVLMVRPGAGRISSIGKLLVPVDGSPGGALAVGTAVGLARASGAALHLVQVVVPLYMQPGSETLGLSYYDPAWADEAALASARGYVDTLVSRLQTAGLTVAGEAHMGEIASKIVEVAGAQATDLIVMSTHALTGLPRAVLGSVAEDLVRTATCPVLLIHRPVSREAIAADEFSEPVSAVSA